MTTPLDPIVEMYVAGEGYVDITDDVRLGNAHSGGGISISRGEPNEGNAAEPTSVSLVVNNREGVYSPHNPNSPYFGKIGRNTPLRVGVQRRDDDFVNRDSSTNLVTNSTFETNTTGWSIVSGVSAIARATERGGNRGEAALRVTPNAASGSVATTVPVTAGTAYRLIGYWYVDTTHTNFFYAVDWLDGGGSTLSTTTGTSRSATGGLWTLITEELTAPANAVNARVRPSYGSTPVLPFFLDDIQMFNPSPGGWGLMSDLKGSWTTVTATPSSFYAMGAAGYIRSTGGTRLAHHGVYGDIDHIVRVKSNIMGAEFGLHARGSFDPDLYWYSFYATPGSPDRLRVGRVAPDNTTTWVLDSPITLVANTYYWLRMVVTNQLIRGKIWADGTDEPAEWAIQIHDYAWSAGESAPPRTGYAGILVGGASPSTVVFDNYRATQYRAHVEVSSWPVRWDLSRQDRWVPLEGKGILRRLGQGRKALESSVYRHLNSYVQATLWHPLEQGGDGFNAGTPLAGARPASYVGLEFGAADDLPGIAGAATLGTAGDYISGWVRPHAVTDTWTFLLFFQVPAAPASQIPIVTLKSTGTANTWVLVLNGVTMNIKAKDRDTELSGDATTLMGFDDIPTGSWIALTLYVRQVGSLVQWAVNYHRPGGDAFYTSGDNTFTGTVGTLASYQMSAVAETEAIGGIKVAHIFAIPTDLPFVTNAFALAANAYIGETAGTRFARLCDEQSIPAIVYGFGSETEEMGPQRQATLLDLLGECADSSDALLYEERFEASLVLRTRKTSYSQYPLDLDVDAGHISAPCEPSDDDQAIRNDVTVKRVLGGSARAIQLEGPLNTNPPETDPDGVGVYDESPEYNVELIDQLTPIANWRLGVGTQIAPRYPSIRLDLTASAYQADPALAVAASSLDSGDLIRIANSEVGADSTEQLVTSYAEQIDLYDWDVTLTSKPADVFRVGVLDQTTRVDTEYSFTTASFVSGTDTALSVSRSDTTNGALWVTEQIQGEAFPFDVMVSGVRLRVKYAGTNQIINSTFETNTTGWTGANANSAVWHSIAQAHSGTGSMMVECVSGAVVSVGAVVQGTDKLAVSPSTQYLFSGWFYSDISIGGGVLIAGDWYQADGTTFISQTAIVLVPYTTPGEWQHITLVATSPVNAGYVFPRVGGILSSGQAFYVDDLRLIRSSTYNADPQILAVEQVPVNGVIKTIPSGSQVRLAEPWVLAW